MKSEALCEICKKNSKSNSNRTAVQRLRNQDQMGGKEINMESSHILCLFGFHVTCGIGKSHILRLARGLYIYISYEIAQDGGYKSSGSLDAEMITG